ncbi:MAG: type I glyceraldehyde-3-phosphate dehydrogenase [bacterium]|nr:type I glyceraldehyde-3-phosphate dehydrogenase [bacterium]
MKKVLINGMGRIGRLVYRILEDDDFFEVVAINDLTDAKQLAYLLKYDTNHRTYKADISYDENHLIINGKKVRVFAEIEPKNIDYKELDIDIVFECTGKYTSEEKALLHIEAGAKKVLISAPAKGNVKTIVYNVNNDTLDGTEQIVSAASCTTNCLAPVLKVIDDNYTIKQGFMTTIHAYTNDQVILDVAHKKDIKERRGRAGAMNIIPTSTGAANAIGLVIPSLQGKLSGKAMRVPVPDGSLIDLSLKLQDKVTKEQINEMFKNNVNETLEYTDDPLVSTDVISTTYGGIVDGLLTEVIENDGEQLVKIVAWYDNEMGYSHQMVRTAKCLFQ